MVSLQMLLKLECRRCVDMIPDSEARVTSPLRKYVCIFREGEPVQPFRSFLFQEFHISINGFNALDDCLGALDGGSCGLLAVDLEGQAEVGFDLLMQASRSHPLVFSVAVIDPDDVHTAVRAMKAGARECVERSARGEWWHGAIEKAFAGWQVQRLHSNGSLTETEKFVLSQVVAGKTSKEIAQLLSRSPRTVEVHRMHIIRKLGVSGTAELVRRAVTIGLIESPSPPRPRARSRRRSVEPVARAPARQPGSS